MNHWHDKVFIYEVNTWVWLDTLSRRYGRPITLAEVPDQALDELAIPGIDIIWLMGVWKRSPFGRAHSLRYKHQYTYALPDITDDDIIGSAYAIFDYTVDERIGGRAGLAAFRQRLAARGLRLLLDFVPNHVAVDHPWVYEHPDYIIQGTRADLHKHPSDFFERLATGFQEHVFAHGRDPLFPGWADTAQLNVLKPGLRRAATETLLDIASQCDGVRCDMAMLVLNDIFHMTWKNYLNGTGVRKEYWAELIAEVRARYPDFLFIAEVYWDREYQVLQQGFDFAYDKTLYDRILEGNIPKLHAHLLASLDHQKQLLRFLENHDEARAYTALGAKKSFPAATLICTLPGACLLHDGQLTGRKVKLPVHIRRQPDEPVNQALHDYYVRLLQEATDPIYQHGDWYLFEPKPVDPINESYRNLLAYGWREAERDYRLVVVNLTKDESVARVPLTYWSELAGRHWGLMDVLNGSHYVRDGSEMAGGGLFVKLKPYESHIFRFVSI